jgi:hypothetical protein
MLFAGLFRRALSKYVSTDGRKALKALGRIGDRSTDAEVEGGTVEHERIAASGKRKANLFRTNRYHFAALAER